MFHVQGSNPSKALKKLFPQMGGVVGEKRGKKASACGGMGGWMTDGPGRTGTDTDRQWTVSASTQIQPKFGAEMGRNGQADQIDPTHLRKGEREGGIPPSLPLSLSLSVPYCATVGNNSLARTR